MAFCDQCGREIAATARFCGYCGARALAEVGSVGTARGSVGSVGGGATATSPAPQEIKPGPVSHGSDTNDVASRLLTIGPLTVALPAGGAVDEAVQSAVQGAVRDVLASARQVHRAVVEPAGKATPVSPAVTANVRLSDGSLIEQRFISSREANTIEIARAGEPVLVAGGQRQSLRGQPSKSAPAATNSSNELDRIAARVSGQGVPPATSMPGPKTGTSASSISGTNRSQTGVYLKWAYLAGIVLIGIGIRVAFFVTRYTTDLYTGHTSMSYPDMGTGIVLVVIGAVLMGGTWLATNGQVRK